MRIVATYLAVAILAAGCASQDARKEAPVSDRSSGGVSQPSASASPAPTATPTQGSSVAGNPLRDPSSILSKRSIFFDYDSNLVKDEYRGLIQAHARYLGDKRDNKIRIEGNCDERGSREYNLALGQRRAESVKKLMTVLGVADGRIETISFGEEKPMATGHDEQAWSQNRRADIKYGGE